jgi:hypothetical protein
VLLLRIHHTAKAVQPGREGEEIGIQRAIDAAAASGRHGGRVEDCGGVAAVEEPVQALDDCLEEAVDAVGAGDLEEAAEDLGRAERRGGGREGRGVEEVEERLEGEVGVGEVEAARPAVRGKGARCGSRVDGCGIYRHTP